MPDGKPAGTRCAQLTPENRCGIYGSAERPAVCASFPPMADHCGSSREEALRLLKEFERLTRE
jgi:Fe-S-cluster containining protein